MPVDQMDGGHFDAELEDIEPSPEDFVPAVEAVSSLFIITILANWMVPIDLVYWPTKHLSEWSCNYPRQSLQVIPASTKIQKDLHQNALLP